MADARRDRAGQLLTVLAHEFRNPLASVQGCALTLLERYDDLPPDMRDGLAKVIVDQSQRMDWLVRATAALAGAIGRREGDVDSAEVIRGAAEFAGLPAVADAGHAFRGDPRRVRLALEALFLALGSQGDAVCELYADGRVLDVRSTALDLAQGARGWKLDLARRLLRDEGCSIVIRRRPTGTLARVRFDDGRKVVPARLPRGPKRRSHG